MIDITRHTMRDGQSKGNVPNTRNNMFCSVSIDNIPVASQECYVKAATNSRLKFPSHYSPYSMQVRPSVGM